MSQGRSRGKTKGVEEFIPYITRVLPVGAQIKCADNSGANILLEFCQLVPKLNVQIIQEQKF